jgi:hypothetical protein
MGATAVALPPHVQSKFCYHFWHTLVPLATKVGDRLRKSPALKWKKKQGFTQFCCLFEFSVVESWYRYQIFT